MGPCLAGLDCGLTQEIAIAAFGALVEGEDVRQANDCRGGADGGESEQADNQALLADGDLKVLDDPEGEETECPVGDNVQCGDGEAEADEDFGFQTGACVRIEIPEGADRGALEEEDEEEDGSEEDCEDHGGADDPDVDFVGGDSQQEEADADFEKAGAEDVEEFAKHPVLLYALACVGVITTEFGKTYSQSSFCSIRLEIHNVFSSAVHKASKLTSQVRRIQQLGSQHRPVIATERLDHTRSHPYSQADGDPCDDKESNANTPDRRTPVVHYAKPTGGEVKRMN